MGPLNIFYYEACLERIVGHFCSWWASWSWSLLFLCTNKQNKSQRWHKNVTENVMFSKSKIITLLSKFYVIEQQKACWELNKTIVSAVSTFRGIKTNGSFSLNDCDQGLCTRNAGEENRCRGSRLPGHADHRGPSSLLSVCSAHPRDSGPGEGKPTQISPTILLWIYSKGLIFLRPKVLHHLNEVGDMLCLKFSRQKYSPRPDLCDGIDYELDSWYDPWQPQFTAASKLSVHVAEERGASQRTRGQIFSCYHLVHIVLCLSFVGKLRWMYVLVIA